MIKELALALWLLDSSLANPTADDLFTVVKTRSADRARKILEQKLKKEGLEKVYREIELPLAPILTRAEKRGVLVDVRRLEKLSIKYHRALSKIESEIYELSGVVFNINSPKQMAGVLFDELGLFARGLKKTGGGQRSTRESELLKLRKTHPVIEKILVHRELQKLLSTYIDAIPKLVDKNSRLHAKLNQTGTVTGRLSSSGPNLQNIPAGEGLGREVRRAFVASPGFCWAAFDYSQIEMRVLAWLSADPELLRVFKEERDIHTAVAARVFAVAEERVTKEMRRRAKVINFGIVYGMGINALRASLGSSYEEAELFYGDYFAVFPRVREFLEELKVRARKERMSRTYFGRRRLLPDLFSPMPHIRAAGERMAVNAPIQGTAADIVKLAMIRVDAAVKKAGLSRVVFLLLQIHDELIYEIAEDKKAKALPLIERAMAEAVQAPVDFPVTVSSGKSWAEIS